MGNSQGVRAFAAGVFFVIFGINLMTHAEEKMPANIVVVNTSSEPMQGGKFAPTWESLEQYQVPEWFRNAKFGIWAHWGPQCQPEHGDWYARLMYIQDDKPDSFYQFHIKKYGHPSQFGFKDVIHEWKAEHWDPEKLVAMYKRAGAQYFFAMAAHHDNFDNFDSKYQPWNSVNIGPKQDIIGRWAKAAHDNGLKFGVSVHSSRAWSWYEVAQGADKTGPFAGVPYDGKMTKADGKGKWWDGYDPQDLYAQNHVPGKRLEWDWDASKGSSIPDQAYCDKFYNRTMDLIDKYHPDLIYFDDNALPLWPVSDAGLKLAANFYNSNMKLHDGKLEAVIFGKSLSESQRKCMVWDIERGQSNVIEPLPWQTDTCLGDWHYNAARFRDHSYKSVGTVIHTLVDVVSKNGNLLLNVPVKGDGTIDDDEVKIVEGITKWMDVNREAIFDTRPWKIFGEGPATENPAPIASAGFNEGKNKPFTADDVRFTTKDGALYAILLGWPTQAVHIKSLGKSAKLADGEITDINLLGSREKIRWSRDDDALTIQPLQTKPCDDAFVFKIAMQK